ncbi:DivIVA domain-containing protein [Kitasatospora sp. NPDC057541]|uniref:DivIVA domain-containing protein n=1 Tax=unclassified Kitasatospora TaxID=2633591 RepID=UPI0036BA62EB
MFWVIVAAMAVVVGGAALVALGGGGSLPEAVQDRISARLPQDRPLGQGDVEALRLPMAVRGYRMDEVDDVLDRLGAELAHRDERIAELEALAAVRGAVVADDRPEPGAEPLPGLEEFARVVEPAVALTKAAAAPGPEGARPADAEPEGRE